MTYEELKAAMLAIAIIHGPDEGLCRECERTYPCQTIAIIGTLVGLPFES